MRVTMKYGKTGLDIDFADNWSVEKIEKKDMPLLEDPLQSLRHVFSHPAGYTHIALVNTGAGDIEPLRERAKENARVLNKQYEEIQGSLDLFRKLIRGPYTSPEFSFSNRDIKLPRKCFYPKPLDACRIESEEDLKFKAL